MPPTHVQVEWTGGHGRALLQRSLALARLVGAASGGFADGGRVLDYGVGWGRISRLLLKYVPADHIDGVDAWESSLAHARGCGLPHPLRRVAPRLEPRELGDGYSIVYAISVFTHLEPTMFSHNLRCLVATLAPGGRLALTVRPPEYWLLPSSLKPLAADERVRDTVADGIVHVPSRGRDGYGDTAVSTEWIEYELRAAGLEELSCDWHHGDPYQVMWSGRRPAS